MSSCVSFIKQTTNKESEQQHKQQNQLAQQQKPEVKEKVSESPKKLHPALSKIAAYSSDEDCNDDDIVKLAKEKRERQKENRKRKFNFSSGSYWGMGKVTPGMTG